MKRIATIAVSIALMGAATAQAGSRYADDISTIRMCEMIAFGAKMSYQQHQQGLTMPEYTQKTSIKPLMNYAAKYGREAVDEQEAYDHVFGKCMDNLTSITLDFNATGEPREDLPY